MHRPADVDPRTSLDQLNRAIHHLSIDVVELYRENQFLRARLSQIAPYVNAGAQTAQFLTVPPPYRPITYAFTVEKSEKQREKMEKEKEKAAL